ncbi:MAG: tRNA 2-thiouridine(34) synthase MnmA [Bacillota bacterium]|nr:tRNA 2-thiouridine(34) synthase MnmA [Bacillota bacterium]
MSGAERVKVMVAMSGGVDSSVAAYILKEEGYDVVGVTLRLWIDPVAEELAGDEARGCCSLEAVNDARMVSAQLGIPHYVLNMQEEFLQDVVGNFTAEYLQGRTPNPCVECNRTIKFSYLIRKASGLGIDKIATGHYARIEYDSTTDLYRLYRGLDRQKDQSYMLYVLGQNELKATLFPLGMKTKQEVRKIAEQQEFKVADKAESQEICFIPDNDYRAFLERQNPDTLSPGNIISTEGLILGRHHGIAFYTVGQRKGLGLTTAEPYYVLKIDADKNEIVVGPVSETYCRGLIAENLNFIAGNPFLEPFEVDLKVRYRAAAIKAFLFPPDNSLARLEFEKPQKSVTPGQSAVFYRGEEVLGGGIIKEVL